MRADGSKVLVRAEARLLAVLITITDDVCVAGRAAWLETKDGGEPGLRIRVTV